MTVLRAEGPRVLGGRDDAVGWHLAGRQRVGRLRRTDQPAPGKPGATTLARTRGELPLALTAQPDAPRGVEELPRPPPAVGLQRVAGCSSVTATRCSSSTSPGLVEPGGRRPRPGSPRPREPTPRRAVAQGRAGVAARACRRAPTPTRPSPRYAGCSGRTAADAAGNPIRGAGRAAPRSSANCVHLDELRHPLLVPHPLRRRPRRRRPQIWVADGPPCTPPFVDVSGLWSPAPASPR